MLKKFNLLLAVVLFSTVSLFSQTGLLMPTPRVLNQALVEGSTTVFPAGEYHFTEWASTNVTSTYPRNMLFYIINATADPDIINDLGSVYADVYNSTSSGKINGRDANGISMGNSGSTRLGAAVIALNTTGRTNINAAWSASTLVAATGFTGTNVGKIYSFTLQYRLSETGAWTTVPNNTFNSSANINVLENFSSILPAACDDQPLVQLRWIYYWSNRLAFTSGSTRPRLGLDDIHITSLDMNSLTPNAITLNQVSQNPVASGLPFSISVKTKFGIYSASIKTAANFVLAKKNADNSYTTLRTSPEMPIGTNTVSFDYLTLADLGVNTLRVSTLTDIGLAPVEFNVNVINAPNKIWFGDILTKGHVGSALPKFVVVARDANLDTNDYCGPITIELANGTVLATAIADSGVAVFDNITFSAPGVYTIVAKALGVANFDQRIININPAVEFEEILVPGYMAGCINNNGYALTDFAVEDRNSNSKYNWTVPAYALVKLKNLHTGLEYRYTSRVQLVNNTAPTTAGNNIYIDEVRDSSYYSGRYITIAGADSLVTPEPFSSFISNTADKNIWMNVVPNTYSYFLNNTRINWILNLATEKGNVFQRFRTTDTTKAVAYGTTSDKITGIFDKSSSLPEGHFLALYTGSGANETLMSVATVQNDGISLVDISGKNPDGTPFAPSGPYFYKNLENAAKSWATIIPNNLGITKIVEYDKDGNVVKSWSDTDGIWGAKNTMDLSGGMINPLDFGTPNTTTASISFLAANCDAAPMAITCTGLHGIANVNVYYMYSNDNGVTYSSPIMIDDTIPTTLQADGNFTLNYNWNFAQFSAFEKPIKLLIVSTEQTNVSITSNNSFLVYNQPKFTQTSGAGLYCKGSRVVLMARAGGTLLPGDAGYRWYRDGKLMNGVNGATYVIASAEFNNSAVYTCEAVSSSLNPCANAMSEGILVYIEEDTRIITDPKPAYNQLGGTAKFTVAAQAVGLPYQYIPSYQWYKDGVALTDNAKYIGSQSPELYVFKITAEDANSDFYAKVTGMCKSATSQSAKIHIVKIDIQSLTANQTLCEGSPLTLAVSAASPTSSLSYTWIKDGSEINGANSDTFAITAANLSNAGTYRVKITDNTTDFKVLSREILVVVNDRTFR